MTPVVGMTGNTEEKPMNAPLKTTAEAATIVTAAVKIVVAKTVALVLAAPAAATSIKTHALLVTFASPRLYRMNMPGEWHEESTADMRV